MGLSTSLATCSAPALLLLFAWPAAAAARPTPLSDSLPQAPEPQLSAQQRQSEQEIRQEEKQRMLGVVPDFLTVNSGEAAPLTPRQKFQLNFRNALDPFTFVLAGLDAGVSQADDSFPGYGQGASGYAKRFGASYADTFDADLWGSAILPVLLHEDPRYFRKGTGSFLGRVLHAAASAVWCRRDNGRWGPNYAYVAGNFIAGGFSNLYYPASDRGAGLTAERAATVTAEGTISSEFFEFWPDIARHFHRHTPPAARLEQSPPHPAASPAP